MTEISRSDPVLASRPSSGPSSSPPPFGYGVVLVCPGFPDTTLRDTLIKALEAAGGISPVEMSNSESALRAHYQPAICPLIVNTANPAMHQLLGQHSAAVCVVVDGNAKDRFAAALRIARTFEDAGFPAEIHNQAEPEFPDGFLHFIVVPALKGIAIMVWPNRAKLEEEYAPEVLRALPEKRSWVNPTTLRCVRSSTADCGDTAPI